MRSVHAVPDAGIDSAITLPSLGYPARIQWQAHERGHIAIQLRNLPSIDRLLKDAALSPAVAEHGTARVKDLLRDIQQGFRSAGEAPDWAGEASGYAQAVAEQLQPRGYRPVFNLTGTIIHTNLGRAPLPPKVWQAVEAIATRPSNLEFDLTTGRRGHRDQAVAERLAAATGAEAACVVNNNAAALLLVLNTFALGKTVPVSRGELIEIGGSFRLPEIMARSGCTLVEIGTTNRTHAKDYAAAVDGAGLILKVHPSNFHIEGFTKTVSLEEMKAVADSAGLPLAVDLGSGTLIDLRRFGLPHEPTPAETLTAGADLVTFSGDKLLGSVQAGLIVGRKDLIDALNKNPLKRALRCDKITLAALSATLDLYEDPDALQKTLPIIQAMTTPEKTLRQRAERVAEALTNRITGSISIEPSSAQIGSGALPDQTLPSISVVVRMASEPELINLQSNLRTLGTPVIGRVSHSALWLDMRGVDQLDELMETLEALV